MIAESGKSAIESAIQNMPDLIIMDIQMPVMDGVEAHRILKNTANTSKIPVIALTSYAMKGDRERFLQDGFDDYIPKPLNLDEFLEKIGKYLDESQK